jgi:hypothetical protein
MTIMTHRLSVLWFIASACAVWIVACTPYASREAEAPVAVAGDDRVLRGDHAKLTLDGSDSYDTDGHIVAFDWRYTGEPAGYQNSDDEDAGPSDPLQDLLKPLPAFCVPPDPKDEINLPARYCLLAPKRGAPDAVDLSLVPGGYRFTLWVTDNDGKASADSIDVRVMP